MDDIPVYEEGIGHLDEPEEYLELILGDYEKQATPEQAMRDDDLAQDWTMTTSIMATTLQDAIDKEILTTLTTQCTTQYSEEIMKKPEAQFEFIRAPTMKDITKYTSTSKIVESIQRRFRHG